jgi:hypothetical protein
MGVLYEVFSCGVHQLIPAKSVVSPEKLQRLFVPDPFHPALHKSFHHSKILRHMQL